MPEKTDQQLEYMYARPSDWSPEALHAARAELNKRRIRVVVIPQRVPTPNPDYVILQNGGKHLLNATSVDILITNRQMKAIMNTMQRFLKLISQSTIFRSAAIVMVALAWNGVAYCGEIHDAAKAGDLEKVKALLKVSPDLVNSRDDKYSRTPLHLAALRGNKDIAELLLANKADVNAKDTNNYVSQLPNGLVLSSDTDKDNRDPGGWTPLHEAAFGGNYDVAKLLLDNKADANVKDNDGATALHLAVYGHKDVVELLLANKADVNATDKLGHTPLFGAASSGHKDLVELLLTHKANVNAKDIYGNTTMQWMTMVGKKEMGELLRQHGGHE